MPVAWCRSLCSVASPVVTKLVFVRHGESNATVERRIGGPLTCTGLSPLGWKQAAALAERLARTGEIIADDLVSSTMPRAFETADVLSAALGSLPVERKVELIEHDPGPDCDGLTFADYVARFGEGDWQRWQTDPYSVGFPGGETLAAFQHRVATAVHTLAEARSGRTVVVVVHGGVIDAALRSLLRLPMVGGFELHTVNTSLTEVERAGRAWRLLRYNDAAHLEGLPGSTPAGSSAASG